MKLINHGKTQDLGGAWSLGKAEKNGRMGSKIKALLKMGREDKLPEYITENVSEELIRLEDLVKVYDTGALKVLGLKRINLTIHRGEFVAIMGQSGSGKSTLMNILGCLDRPSMGHYYLDGVDVAAMNPDELSLIRNRKIGFVFQSFNLISRTSALKNVELPMTYARKNKKFREQRAKVLLERVGLGKRAEHMPNELSGGQRQRVAIARALANEPPLPSCSVSFPSVSLAFNSSCFLSSKASSSSFAKGFSISPLMVSKLASSRFSFSLRSKSSSPME